MSWVGHPGSGPVTFDGTIAVSSGNWALGSGANIGSGDQVMAIANAVTVPVSLAALFGGVMYVQSGHLKYIGQLGTVTTVASA